MGNVISLDERRQRRRVPAVAPGVVFSFVLGSVDTYFAAERVDRSFARVVWEPVIVGTPEANPPAVCCDADRYVQRARDLRLPLVWPEGLGTGRAAMRVASLAAERGRGAAFVLAASRLMYCGGFDLDDADVLTEAAGAAGLSSDDFQAAVGDVERDAAMKLAGRRLVAAGATEFPVLSVGQSLFAGEQCVVEAAATARLAFGMRPAPAFSG